MAIVDLRPVTNLPQVRRGTTGLQRRCQSVLLEVPRVPLLEIVMTLIDGSRWM